jgi:hypothetical protein
VGLVFKLAGAVRYEHPRLAIGQENGAPLVSIRWLAGYWTVFAGEQPLVSCVDFTSAYRLVMCA